MWGERLRVRTGCEFLNREYIVLEMQLTAL